MPPFRYRRARSIPAQVRAMIDDRLKKVSPPIASVTSTGYTYSDQQPSGNPAAWQIDQAGGTGTPTYGTLSGLINGANAVYTVSAAQYLTGTLTVYRNGVLVAQGTGANEWGETSTSAGTFTLVTAPLTGDWLMAIYQVGA